MSRPAETIVEEAVSEEFTGAIRRLNSDTRLAAKNLSDREARYLVDLYYQAQGVRLRVEDQARKAAATGIEPSSFLNFMFEQFLAAEKNIQKAMDIYTKNHKVTRWMRSIYGIGPVLAAGLHARVNIEKAHTAGSLWRYCGLDPSIVWNKGEKCPYNPAMKVHCWRIGSSFVKFHKKEECLYGLLFDARKSYEIENNEKRVYAPLAAKALETRKIKDETLRATYEDGRLPAGRIHARAQRYAVKMFLSHYHHVAREVAGLSVPKPYVLDHLGHTHFLAPPNWPLEE